MPSYRLQGSALAALLLAAVGALAQPAAAIRVEGVWARRAVMIKTSDPSAGTGTGAVYFTLVNGGSVADALLAVASDAAAAVEIHETYMESAMAKMRPVARIAVPAGRTVELKPGGYHVMLINLTRDLVPGKSIDLTLTFQHAGKVAVSAQIK